VNSFTFDNGSEFARHREIAAQHNATVYFADPHGPLAAGLEREHQWAYPVVFPEGHGLQEGYERGGAARHRFDKQPPPQTTGMAVAA
jgi:hypothetical protein